MRVLDLTDNMLLLCGAQGLFLVDRRHSPAVAEDAFFIAEPPEDLGLETAAVTAVFRAARRTADGVLQHIDHVDWEESHEIYAGKVLEGVAHFDDGPSEYWRLRVDPNLMRFQWNRQPERATDQPVLQAFVPRRRDVLQFWRTGDGEQLVNEAIPLAQGHAEALILRDESELLFYAEAARNALRLEMPTGIALKIANDHAPNDVQPAGALAWALEWEAAPTAVLQITVTCGLTNAVRHFDGCQRMFPANAALDFDTFYSRVYLGCLPLNLYRGKRGLLCANALAFHPAGASREPASLHDITWACECAALLDPVIIAALARDALLAAMPGLLEGGNSTDVDVALFLLLAGKHYQLTGDLEFATELLPSMRRCAQRILALREPGCYLPALDRTGGSNSRRTIEPEYTALCHMGLVRLGIVETALGHADVAEWWARAALVMRTTACLSYEEGGLRDPEYNTFIRGVELADAPGGLSRPVREFLLRQNVVAFHLGLYEGPEQLQQAYDWIDDRYTYASGRGGVTVPPGLDRTFIALLDVGVRHHHDIPGAGPLLSFVLAHALDGGLPFTDTPFGVFSGGGPTEAPGAPPRFAHTCAGSLLDNSPYFDLVLRQHYGLHYSHEGWHIGTPKPLPGYPLTRVTHLRHRHALYAITWQGRGKVRRILVGGTPFHGDVLAHAEGDHEVVVQLQ